AVALPPSPLRAADGLTVTQSGPEGEIGSAAEANEIRVVFSQPMVVLGRIPDPVVVPWFHISPKLPGAFRWSGTRTLIFTPASLDQIPFATEYTVTIDAAAQSVDGAT